MSRRRTQRGAWITVAVGLACLGVLAAGWSRRDDLRALVSPDFAAWREVVRLIESRRSADAQAQGPIHLPYTPVEIPGEFEVRLHTPTMDTRLLAIRMRCRNRQAMGEMASNRGLLRGEVPWPAIEQLLRKATHLKRAVQLERFANFSHASQAPVYFVDFTGPEGLILEASGHATLTSEKDQDRFGPFVHSWLCEEIRRLADAHLRPVDIQVEQAMTLDVLQQAGAMPKGVDFDSVLARIHASRAVQMRLREALPFLTRLNFTLEARMLEVATAADPSEGLKECLLGGNNGSEEAWHLAIWGLDFMEHSVDRERRKQVLLDALGAIEDQRLKACVLEDLSSFKGDPAVEDALRRVVASTTDEAGIRTRAAAALFCVSGELAALEYLLDRVPDLGGERQGLLDEEREAVKALSALGTRCAGRRDEAAEALRGLVEKVPSRKNVMKSGLCVVLEALGKLRRPEDEDFISKHLEDDSVACEAIHALALINPERAVEAARGRIRFYVASGGKGCSYRWNVREYFWLLCALEGREAVAEIEAAMLHSTEEWTLLRLLRARSLEERLRGILEYVSAYPPPRDELFDLMMVRLKAQGADPRALALIDEALPPRMGSAVEW